MSNFKNLQPSEYFRSIFNRFLDPQVSLTYALFPQIFVQITQSDQIDPVAEYGNEYYRSTEMSFERT